MKKRGKEKPIGFVYQNFLKSIDELKNIKNYFFFSLSLFILVGLFGFLFPVLFEERILAIIRNLIDQTEGLNTYELISFIVSNNIQSSFFGMLSGIIIAVPSLFILVFNAYILGFVAHYTVAETNVFILWRLIPHGILEIPAVLISLSIGIRLGFLLMSDALTKLDKKINSFNKTLFIILSLIIFPLSFIFYATVTLSTQDLRRRFIGNFIEGLRMFIFIIVPILVIAGIIEGILIYFVG